MSLDQLLFSLILN